MNRYREERYDQHLSIHERDTRPEREAQGEVGIDKEKRNEHNGWLRADIGQLRIVMQNGEAKNENSWHSATIVVWRAPKEGEAAVDDKCRKTSHTPGNWSRSTTSSHVCVLVVMVEFRPMDPS